MARTFYSVVLCAALALLATMWLRPGVAQDLLALATGMRAQSPDAGANIPPLPGYGGVPYSNVPSTPMQPLPVVRPVTWPGMPVDSYHATPTGNPPATVPRTGLQPGVAVWDPSGNRYAAGPAPAPTLPPGNSVQPTAQLAQFAAPPVGATPYVQPAPQPSVAQPPPANYGGPPANVAPPGYAAPMAGPQFSPPLLPPTGAEALPPATLAQELPDAQVAAKVGSEVILVGDVKAFMHQIIEQKRNGNKEMEIKPEQFEEFYKAFARPVLKQLIEIKLVYNDAIHTVPAAGMTKIQSNINEEFDKKQLPQLMKSAGAGTRQELDAKLGQNHSSLEWERRSFLEKQLYLAWISQQVVEKDKDQEVPLSEVIGYYRQHHADYEYPAQARWEELMVSFDRTPDRAAAMATIAEMGNAVQRGAPFAEVAQARSQGFTAASGGAFDWTTQGSLVSKNIDEAIFGLPKGALSQIITSDRGYHIVRVVERKPAGRKSFEETQTDIRKKMKEEIRDKQIKKFLEELRQKTPVSTMFDDQPGGLDGPPKEEQHIL